MISYKNIRNGRRDGPTDGQSLLMRCEDASKKVKKKKGREKRKKEGRKEKRKRKNERKT